MKLLSLLKEIIIEPEDTDRGFLRSLNTAIAQFIRDTILKSHNIDSITINIGGSEYTYVDGELPTPEEVATAITDELNNRGVSTKQSFLLYSGLIEPEEIGYIPTLYPTALSIIPSLYFLETFGDPYVEVRQALQFISAYNRGGDPGKILLVSFNYE